MARSIAQDTQPGDWVTTPYHSGRLAAIIRGVGTGSVTLIWEDGYTEHIGSAARVTRWGRNW